MLNRGKVKCSAPRQAERIRHHILQRDVRRTDDRAAASILMPGPCRTRSALPRPAPSDFLDGSLVRRFPVASLETGRTLSRACPDGGRH
ncbi:hypothetical protein VTN00DRAFT_2684 [Thermoascus crustaceus]|uniref:uncharacterized protein n=1 Tax=Thermoascus crustaceus TaxID=5088 RepID=UPI003742AD16